MLFKIVFIGYIQGNTVNSLQGSFWHGGDVERQASNWIVSWCGNASLCLWERHLMLFLTLRPSSLPVVVAQP